MVARLVHSERSRSITAAVALGALLTGLVWFIASPATGAETLRFFARARELEETRVDANDSGTADPGDSFNGQFILRQDGDKAGHFQFHCVHTSAPPMRNLCGGAVRVSGKGTIQVQGGQDDNADEVTAAIVGGTGAYRSASGIIHLKFARHGLHIRLEID